MSIAFVMRTMYTRPSFANTATMTLKKFELGGIVSVKKFLTTETETSSIFKLADLICPEIDPIRRQHIKKQDSDKFTELIEKIIHELLGHNNTSAKSMGRFNEHSILYMDYFDNHAKEAGITLDIDKHVLK